MGLLASSKWTDGQTVKASTDKKVTHTHTHRHRHRYRVIQRYIDRRTTDKGQGTLDIGCWTTVSPKVENVQTNRADIELCWCVGGKEAEEEGRGEEK